MERDWRESGSDMCKSVTYTALLQAHLQRQVKILLCLALTVGEGDEVGQRRREGRCDDKSRGQELLLCISLRR